MQTINWHIFNTFWVLSVVVVTNNKAYAKSPPPIFFRGSRRQSLNLSQVDFKSPVSHIFHQSVTLLYVTDSGDYCHWQLQWETVTVTCATWDWVLVLFSTVLSELVYIWPTVCISYTAIGVLCIIFGWFCDHDMVTCSVVRVKSWSSFFVWTEKFYLRHWTHLNVLYVVHIDRPGSGL